MINEPLALDSNINYTVTEDGDTFSLLRNKEEPMYPVFESAEARDGTFTDTWNNENASIDKLVEAGFYYLGKKLPC